MSIKKEEGVTLVALSITIIVIIILAGIAINGSTNMIKKAKLESLKKPKLKSSNNFLNLMNTIIGSENMIVIKIIIISPILYFFLSLNLVFFMQYHTPLCLFKYYNIF